MNEVVKYHNDLNTVVMKRWTSSELNLFFTVIAKAREKGSNMVKLDAKQLKELMEFKPTTIYRWQDIMKSAIQKLGTIQYYEETEDKFETMMLFSRFSYDRNLDELEVILSENYRHILNNITSNFTIFELKEFVGLRSAYSKTMYRLLKQWRTIGKKRFKKEDLFMLLDVPVSTQAPRNFNPRVMEPIIAELSEVFTGLKVEQIHAAKRGRPITHYEFTWQAEKVGTWIEEKYDKKYHPKSKNKKQELIPEWMKDDYKPDTSQASDPEKVAQLQEKLARLFGESD